MVRLTLSLVMAVWLGTGIVVSLRLCVYAMRSTCQHVFGRAGSGSEILRLRSSWQRTCPVQPTKLLHSFSAGAAARGPAHNGDEDVQPGRQRAAVLAEPLHHISCRQTSRWGGACAPFRTCAAGLVKGPPATCMQLRQSRLHPTCLLRHDADDGVGRCGARRKWAGGVEIVRPSCASSAGSEGPGVCRQEEQAAAAAEGRKWERRIARQGWLIN